MIVTDALRGLESPSKRMAGKQELVAVIPAFNEAGHVGKVVESTRPFVDHVIVVDDGSQDDTAAEASSAGACVYRHLINRGVGGATATGLKAALKLGADIIVLLDADGQHVPADIQRVLEPIQRGEVDFVIGCRLLNPEGMPLSRYLANRAADLCTWLLFGIRVKDSQSGFRGFSRQVAESIGIRTSGMEVCSEMVAEVARRGFRIAEVPITVVYTDYSLSKGQNFHVGLQTLAKLVLRRSA
jgi:glycosyltransferase involved in cell wall biosynthesis